MSLHCREVSFDKFISIRILVLCLMYIQSVGILANLPKGPEASLILKGEGPILTILFYTQAARSGVVTLEMRRNVVHPRGQAFC